MAKRHLLAHYVDIAMDSTLSNTDYHLIGEGVSSLTEEMGGEEETNQWINEEDSTTTTKSYRPTISIERQNVDQDDTDMTNWFDELIDTLPRDEDAITSYVRLRLKGDGPSYPAVQRMCSVLVNSTGGDAGSNITDSITLSSRGAAIKGTFNITTRKFTATAAPASRSGGTSLSD